MQINYQKFNNKKVIRSDSLMWLIVKDYDKVYTYMIPFVYNKNSNKVMVLIDNKIFEKDFSKLTDLELYPETEENKKAKQKVKQEISDEMFCKIIKHYTGGGENLKFRTRVHSQYIAIYKSIIFDKTYHASSNYKYVEVDKLPKLAKIFSKHETHYIIRDKQLNINCSQSWSTYYQYNKEYTK